MSSVEVIKQERSGIVRRGLVAAGISALAVGGVSACTVSLPSKTTHETVHLNTSKGGLLPAQYRFPLENGDFLQFSEYGAKVIKVTTMSGHILREKETYTQNHHLGPITVKNKTVQIIDNPQPAGELIQNLERVEPKFELDGCAPDGHETSTIRYVFSGEPQEITGFELPENCTDPRLQKLSSISILGSSYPVVQ